MPIFTRYIGIDYSGAQKCTSRLRSLQVFSAEGNKQSRKVCPPESRDRNWTRRGIAAWLLEELSKPQKIIVGIDHGFSFPLQYFDAHHVPYDWSKFLKDFCHHWPTDRNEASVELIRKGLLGQGRHRTGNARWRRLTEIRAGGAKSVFHFDVQGSVAKSTHAGIPWLYQLRQQLPQKIHFWPFDGWNIPPRRSVIMEVYPRLWSSEFPKNIRTPDEHDAYSVSKWLQRADQKDLLQPLFNPKLTKDEREIAAIEGWIFGVNGQQDK